MRQITYALLTSLILVFAGCKDDDNDTPSGPREREVEYRVSSPNNGVTADVTYTNETGAFTTDDPATLPKSYKFKRTLKANDAISCAASLNSSAPNHELTVTILLDGQQVETQTGRGGIAYTSLVHLVR